MVVTWGLRLVIYLVTRVIGHPEEGRESASVKGWIVSHYRFDMRGSREGAPLRALCHVFGQLCCAPPTPRVKLELAFECPQIRRRLLQAGAPAVSLSRFAISHSQTLF